MRSTTLSVRPAKLAALLAIAGVTLFLGLMAAAVAFYPGGNRFDATALGYGFFTSFWCDLFDETSYSGAPNAGRPFAVVASVIFPLSMIPFWITIPPTISGKRRLTRAVAVLGTLSMVAGALVPTRLHDPMILLAGPTGGAAVMLLLREMSSNGWRVFAMTALIPLAFAACNFFLWITQWHVEWIPAIQKTALGGTLVWLVSVALGVLRRR